MTSKIISLKDKAEWSVYLDRLPTSMQDIYYSPEYYEIYEKNGDGRAFCFVFEQDGKLALYPFLRNCINDLGYKLEEAYYDIQGIYGYNGVVYSSITPGFVKNFYSEFNKYCKGNNIVVEFTRFNPLLKNYVFSKDYLDVNYNRNTVYVNLIQSYEDIYKNYSASNRKAIKRAQKENLNVIICKDEFQYKREFIEMYNEVMQNVHAKKQLRFNDSYFNEIFKNTKLIQFTVFKDLIPIASMLNLAYKDYIHCHLLGYKMSYLKSRPNNFIYDELIKYSINKGYKKINFGGGRSSYEDDSLLKFKMNFSNTMEKFYIGGKIWNEKIYTEVIRQWDKINFEHYEPSNSNLLRYRDVLGES